MAEEQGGTSGGATGTSGARRRALLWFVLGFAVIVALVTVANAESTIADFAAAGVPETAWHIWLWELSSVAAWITVLPAIWWAVARLRPPRLRWPIALLVLVALSVPASLWHIAVMVGLRKLGYAAEGLPYAFFHRARSELLYEYRKDLVTFVQFASSCWFAQWLLARLPADDAVPAPRLLEVSDGAVTHRVPIDEIEHIAAAGNYVEIAWGQNSLRTLLHRATLESLARDLGSDFVRIHRSRLVRHAAIRRIETDRSGDFTVELKSGALLRGSRRYREALRSEAEARA